MGTGVPGPGRVIPWIGVPVCQRGGPLSVRKRPGWGAGARWQGTRCQGLGCGQKQLGLADCAHLGETTPHGIFPVPGLGSASLRKKGL